METKEHTLESSIVRQEFGGIDTTAVCARLLHEFLEVGKDFSTWIKDQIAQYGFVEGVDFATYSAGPQKRGVGNRGAKKEYALTVDTAKEISMVQRNAKGKEARLYFINMEKRAKELATSVPKSLPEALRLAASLCERAEKAEDQIKALEAKYLLPEGSMTLWVAAKAMGYGEKRLRWRLRELKILRDGRIDPIWIENGLFCEREAEITGESTDHQVKYEALITPLGFERISAMLREKGYIK